MNTSPVKESLPELPLAWEFVYDFTVPGGVKRKIDSNRYNGSKPSRSLTVYTADQMHEYGRQCALQAIAAPREHFPRRIWELLKDVADRTGKEGFAQWEDGNGEPLQDDAEAALAWIAAPREGWQEISTAPKDGAVYLASDGHSVRSECHPPQHLPGEWDWDERHKEWRGHAHCASFKATLWHPVPPLPAAPLAVEATEK